MDDQSSSDHLGSSLTDLMTSLMVIFILLLLVFISHTASKDAAMTDTLLKQLQQDFKPQDAAERVVDIRKDRVPNVILIIVPDNLMGFDPSKDLLKPDGSIFLDSFTPLLAKTICDQKFRNSVDSIVVEGHTDRTKPLGQMAEQGQKYNLNLSQKRSLAVVNKSLDTLSSSEPDRTCFLEELSATGRGEQDCDKSLPADSGECRQVIFKIRVKAKEESSIEQRLAK
jgi:outer membrane protein OmpA-like peptidoglycan-associated protein